MGSGSQEASRMARPYGRLDHLTVEVGKSKIRLNPWRRSVTVSPRLMPMSSKRILRKASLKAMSTSWAVLLARLLLGASTSSCSSIISWTTSLSTKSSHCQTNFDHSLKPIYAPHICSQEHRIGPTDREVWVTLAPTDCGTICTFLRDYAPTHCLL